MCLCVYCVRARVHAHVCIRRQCGRMADIVVTILEETVQSVDTFCAVDHMQNYFTSIIPNAAKHLAIRTRDIAVTDRAQRTPSLIQNH